MGKPTGGPRPNALMPVVYRTWTKIRRTQIDAWEVARAGPWDAAIEGSSALRARILSVLGDEIAVRTGNDTWSTLLDMGKFYDNIDIPQLIELADHQAYPALILNLGLQMHMAPRGLRCYRHCPGQVRWNHGIIAGCTKSTTFAKIYLKVVLQGL